MPVRDYWTVVLGSAAITQQMCTVAAAAAVTFHLHQRTITAVTILYMALGLALTGVRGGCAKECFNVHLP